MKASVKLCVAPKQVQASDAGSQAGKRGTQARRPAQNPPAEAPLSREEEPQQQTIANYSKLFNNDINNSKLYIYACHCCVLSTLCASHSVVISSPVCLDHLVTRGCGRHLPFALLGSLKRHDNLVPQA